MNFFYRPTKLADILQKLHKTADSDGDTAVPGAPYDESTAAAASPFAASPYVASPKSINEDDRSDSALPPENPLGNLGFGDVEKGNGDSAEDGVLPWRGDKKSEEKVKNSIGIAGDSETMNSAADLNLVPAASVSSGSADPVPISDDVKCGEHRDGELGGGKVTTAEVAKLSIKVKL